MTQNLATKMSYHIAGKFGRELNLVILIGDLAS